MMQKNVFFILFLILSFSTFSQNKKLLIIGIDGCRADVINKKFAPTMDSIIHLSNTAYTYRMKNENHTMSAANWSSMLTSVHWKKHGAKNNEKFENGDFVKYPHFYKYLKEQKPDLKLASFPGWTDINRLIVLNNADYAPVYKKDVPDTLVAAQMLRWLDVANDSIFDANFIHFNDVDHNGHTTGFSPKNVNYTNEVRVKDEFVKKVFAAIKLRKEKYNEDWLVIISTDHGGRRTGNNNNGHSVGIINPHIRRNFLIINGADTKAGKISNKPRTIDIAYTALKFFGVNINPKWKLQGKSVGIK